jgi:signal transduction histidine kinase
MLPAGAAEAKSRLKKVQALSVHILDEIHRLTYELRPSMLDDLGLVAATRWLADNILAVAGVKVDFKTIGRPRRLAPKLETCLFRVIQESINNMVRHAQAKNATIVLGFQKNAILLHIKDDGKGFDVEEAITSKDRPRGLGLLGMKERVALMNGTLDVRSTSAGTEVEAKIPSSKGEEGK